MFPISEAEYKILDKKFGSLCHYAVWQLKKKNTNNCMINDHEDDVQELRIALMRAGSYHKRQTYIEACFAALNNVKIPCKLMRNVLKQLRFLWDSRRRHGANRQKFGQYHEVMLDKLVQKYVAKKLRPDKSQSLKVDGCFSAYCKGIVWNAQKSLGKQITKEKTIRANMISLSEFDYLGTEKAELTI